VKEVGTRAIFVAIQFVEAAKRDHAIATILVEGELMDKFKAASIEGQTNAVTK
jgi:hypothetical protein